MFEKYTFSPAFLSMEIGVFVLAVLMVRHAWTQRRNWLATLLGGMGVGIALEVAIVAYADPAKIYYTYGTDRFLFSLWNVPVCVGVGWGIVLYASSWTAHRLNIPWVQRALVAGALAVNIDLSLDPVAHALGFWTWHWPDPEQSRILSYYGVPFDNFVAWFGIVALFSFIVRYGFRRADRWFPRTQSSWVTNAIVPVLALAVSAGVFLFVRAHIDKLYDYLNVTGDGQAAVFVGLFALTSWFLWRHNLASRRDMALHKVILAVPISFHALCLILLVAQGLDKQPSLLVLIPMTAVVGFFSYIWPSIDTFLARGNAKAHDRQRKALIELLTPLTPALLANEQQALLKQEPGANKRKLLAYRITDIVHAVHERNAGSDAGAGEPRQVYERQLAAVAKILDCASDALVIGGGRPARMEKLADALLTAAARASEETEVEDTRLFSYGGEFVDARVYRPRTREELARLLKSFLRGSRSITFRAGGNAFDKQSLNETVVSLEHFTGIQVDPINAQVTVGAGATWGDILKETLKHDLVPYVMVTTRTATAGGTLSADSLSRFSPTCGKEGMHVASFLLMKLDGTLEVCSRTERRDLFRAAVAGLGYVGAVVEVTYDLLRVPFDASKIAVLTDFRVCDMPNVADALVDGALQVQPCVSRDGNHQLVSKTNDPFTQIKALSAVIYQPGRGKGLIAKSKYRQAEKSEWKRSTFHHPFSVGHLLLQLMAYIPGLRELGYWYTFSVAFKKPQSFVDEIFGYTFFEDGNRVIRSLGRRIWLPMGIRQQTFVVRWDRQQPADSKANLARFLEKAEALLEARGLSPALIDVLYVPDDGVDDFLLTSNYDLAGFAVTYTFEKLFSARFPEVEKFFCELSEIVGGEFRGRVHLVKNVHADARVIREMYAGRLDMMAALRHTEGVTETLRNEFMHRVLPSLAVPPPGHASSAPPPSSDGLAAGGPPALLPGDPASSVVVADGAGK